MHVGGERHIWNLGYIRYIFQSICMKANCVSWKAKTSHQFINVPSIWNLGYIRYLAQVICMKTNCVSWIAKASYQIMSLLFDILATSDTLLRSYVLKWIVYFEWQKHLIKLCPFNMKLLTFLEGSDPVRSGTCDPGWLPFDYACYKFVTTKRVTASDAKTECYSQHGARLMRISGTKQIVSMSSCHTRVLFFHRSLYIV